MSGLLNITIGAITYGFELSGDPIHTAEKSLAGEIQRQTGNLRRGDQIDAPRSRSTITGIGVSRIVETIPNAATRAWEMKNIDAWPGMWCLGPNARTTTDIALARQVLGFAEGISKVFYFSEHATRENIAYFVGSTTTWTDATATLDWDAIVGPGVGFPCRAMWEHNDAGTAKMYALRKLVMGDGSDPATSSWQLMSSTNGTTWTAVVHNAGTGSPSNEGMAGQLEGVIPVIGGIDIDGTSYTLTYSGTTVQLRQATGTLATWSNSTGGSFTSSNAPISLVAWANSAGTVQPFAFTREGIYRYTGSAWVREVRWGYVDTNNGLFPVVWQPADLGTDFLVVANGPNLYAFYWVISGSNVRLQQRPISPIYRTQGLPTYRQGRILALAVSGQFLWAFIGGEDADHTGGWYKNAYASPDTWIGPVYAAAAANRIARAAIFSSMDDNTGRLHIAMDNGTASDTDQLFFLDIDRDPRTVTSYQHTAATGSLVLPKDDLDLPEVLGIFRKVEATGTNISATNKLDDIFASNDAAPIAADGSWGTTLGEITATGGSVNYAGTPAGTGLSARASQVRADLIGASNASCYVETVNLYAKKVPTIKDIWVFPIDLQKSAFESNGSVPTRTLETVMSDLEAVRDAATDVSVTVGSRLSSVVMEPYRLGGTPAIEYDTKIVPFGSDSGQDKPRIALLRLVEV